MTIENTDIFQEGKLIHEDRLREAAQARLANQYRSRYFTGLRNFLHTIFVSIAH